MGKLAINVKDHHVYQIDPNYRLAYETLGENTIEQAYEHAVFVFWKLDVPELCRDHGFELFYQDGRSGGWLVVEGDEDDPGTMSSFNALAADVMRAMDSARDYFREELQTILTDESHIMRGSS